MKLFEFETPALTEGQRLDLTKNWPSYDRVVGEIVGSKGRKYVIKIVVADGTGKLAVGNMITIAPNYVKRMPVVTESDDTAWMGKLEQSGKIVRIIRKQHDVKFSDDKGWLLIDTDPAKGNRAMGLKWIPADTRFEWVRPYKETIDEDTSDWEFRNIDKLDYVLMSLCRMIVQGQKINSDLGMVAACVIDTEDRKVMGINYPDSKGKRVHAERAAIENYTKQYGEIPAGSIIVTTLSPCTDSKMHERHGGNCADLISNTNVHKVYCGYQDPSQQDTDRDYNLMVTDNARLRSLCKDFADTFLKENFADGKNPGRKGLAKRSGVDCKQSVTKLRDIAAHSSGERQRMAHWCANMKAGKNK